MHGHTHSHTAQRRQMHKQYRRYKSYKNENLKGIIDVYVCMKEFLEYRIYMQYRRSKLQKLESERSICTYLRMHE